MMKLKYYFFAALMMMIVACSDNADQSSGDMPVPPESYETVLSMHGNTRLNC